MLNISHICALVLSGSRPETIWTNPQLSSVKRNRFEVKIKTCCSFLRFPLFIVNLLYRNVDIRLLRHEAEYYGITPLGICTTKSPWHFSSCECYVDISSEASHVMRRSIQVLLWWCLVSWSYSRAWSEESCQILINLPTFNTDVSLLVIDNKFDAHFQLHLLLYIPNLITNHLERRMCKTVNR